MDRKRMCRAAVLVAGLVFLAIAGLGTPAVPSVAATSLGGSQPLKERASALVVLLGFPDAPAGALSVSKAEGVFFGPKGSVRAYYLAQSRGIFDLAGTVVGGKDAGQQGPDLILPWPTAHYRAMGRLAGQEAMAQDALTLLGRAGFNFQPYRDASGAITQAVFLFSAPMTYDASSPFFFGWTYWDRQMAALPSGTPVIGGTFAAQTDGMGTFAHEFGHLLGFRDTYNTAAVPAGPTRCIEGVWDLYDSGNANGQGRLPAPIDPAQRVLAGWIRPTTLHVSGTYVLPPVETSGQVDEVALPGSPDVLMLENVEPVGTGRGLPGKGLLVWAVDTSSATPANPAWNLDTADAVPVGSRAQPAIRLLSAGGDIAATCGSSADPFPGSSGVHQLGAGAGVHLAALPPTPAVDRIRLVGADVRFHLTVSRPEVAAR